MITMETLKETQYKLMNGINSEATEVQQSVVVLLWEYGKFNQ